MIGLVVDVGPHDLILTLALPTNISKCDASSLQHEHHSGHDHTGYQDGHHKWRAKMATRSCFVE